MSDTAYLKKEDYEEPCCPFEKPDRKETIPIGRVISRLDEYLNRNDLAAAERHLKYWRQEADLCRDERGRLSILNEQIGLYRKMGRETECNEAIESALRQLEALGMETSVTAGTTYINAATGFSSFRHFDRALPLYESARRLYEEKLPPSDYKLGGLYNNMAITLAALKRYPDAEELYSRAMAVMKQNKGTEGEIAVTYCNLADLAAVQGNSPEDYLKKAEELLNAHILPDNGYYAFICEKCAPTFGYYGHKETEKALLKRAKEIYERN